MECVEKEFKGKSELHVVLNPSDLDCLFSLLLTAKSALRKTGPWANEAEWPTYANTLEWFETSIRECRDQTPKS